MEWHVGQCVAEGDSIGTVTKVGKRDVVVMYSGERSVTYRAKDGSVQGNNDRWSTRDYLRPVTTEEIQAIRDRNRMLRKRNCIDDLHWRICQDSRVPDAAVVEVYDVLVRYGLAKEIG